METHKHSPEGSQLSLKEVILKVADLFTYLKGFWKPILTVAVIGGLLGLVLALISPPSYTASSSFIVEGGPKGIGGSYAGIASKLGLSIGAESSGDIYKNDDNIILLLKSRTMISSTFYTYGNFLGTRQLLVERYYDLNNLRKRWVLTFSSGLRAASR